MSKPTTVLPRPCTTSRSQTSGHSHECLCSGRWHASTIPSTIPSAGYNSKEFGGCDWRTWQDTQTRSNWCGQDMGASEVSKAKRCNSSSRYCAQVFCVWLCGPSERGCLQSTHRAWRCVSHVLHTKHELPVVQIVASSRCLVLHVPSLREAKVAPAPFNA